MKLFYSAKELSEMNLHGLPSTVQNITATANRNNWNKQERQGRGGGYEYEVASMPPEIQQQIREYEIANLVIEPRHAKVKSLTIPESKELDQLTTEQREIADARLYLVAAVAELEKTTTRLNAVKTIVKQAKAGELEPSLQEAAYLANARRQKGRVISERSLMRYVLTAAKCETPAERVQALAPGQPKAKPLKSIPWLPLFLKIYQAPSGISVEEAYVEFVNICIAQKKEYPTIHQVRYALRRMSEIDREKGRVTGSDRKAVLPYVKRNWEVLGLNGAWVGDGTSMKLKVQHPDHGRPFIPELTMIIDAANRYIVGWSVSLAENTLAVADAFRHGVEKHGLPLIYYSDNGGGQTAKHLDHDVTGIFARLGVEHKTGIPGNPQGRGIIERLNRTVAQRIARQFPTYFGGNADRESTRKMLVAVESASNAVAKGKELTVQQSSAVNKIPSWAEFIAMCEAGIDWYNNEHIHRELGTTPAEARKKQLETAEVDYLTDAEIRDLFRPSEIRTVQRGWVSLYNNQYFSMDLAPYNGLEVQVSFDIHDASSVIIRDMDGRFICEAEFDGNKRDAFPKAYVEEVRERRRKNRLRTLQKRMEEVEAEARGTIDHQPDFSNFIEMPKDEKEPVFLFESEREEFELKKKKA